MLSIEKITALGNPYHGLLVDGHLIIPNRRQVTNPNIKNGDTQLVSFSHLSARDKSVAPKENNSKYRFEWRTKAIISDKHLGGAISDHASRAICIVMDTTNGECHHVLIRLPNGMLYDGGVGVHDENHYDARFKIESCINY